MNEEITLQLYTVRKSLSKDLALTLAAVRSAGYKSVSLAGFCGWKKEMMIDELRRNSLICRSAHCPFEDLEKSADETAEFLKEAGAEYCVIPWTDHGIFKDAKAFSKRIDGVNEICEVMKKHGVSTLYHNHHFEFSGESGKTPLDIIMGECKEVGWQVDSGWLDYSGADADTFLTTYSNRIKSLQFKDMIFGKAGDYSVYSKANERELTFERDGFEFVAVGRGKLNAKKYADFAKSHGVTFLEVEQDQAPEYGELSDAKSGLDFVRTLFAD